MKISRMKYFSQQINTIKVTGTAEHGQKHGLTTVPAAEGQAEVFRPQHSRESRSPDRENIST